jgi:hypothetical protein
MSGVAFPPTVQDMVLPYFELFILAHRITDAKFGIAAVNDHRFMPRLREGRVTLHTVNRALAYARGATRNGAEP